MRSLIVAVVLVLSAASAWAQQQRFPLNATLTASVQHDGVNTVGYRLKLDGKSLGDLPPAARVGNVVTGTLIASPVGDRTLAFCAFNRDGVGGADIEACTPPITFNVYTAVPPAVPTNFTISIKMAVNEFGDPSFVSVDVTRDDTPSPPTSPTPPAATVPGQQQ